MEYTVENTVENTAETTEQTSAAPVHEVHERDRTGPLQRVRDWLAQRFGCIGEEKLEGLPDFADTIQPAMERMTDELIRETVGPDGVLTKEFKGQISKYDINRNPISPSEARALINSLLDLAASRRKLLNERLERSVEVGSLYRSYYGRVQKVDSLAAQAYTAMERMTLAEEDFHYHNAMLKKVRDNSVVPAMMPDDEEMNFIDKIREQRLARKRDIMEALDEMGGNKL